MGGVRWIGPCESNCDAGGNMDGGRGLGVVGMSGEEEGGGGKSSGCCVTCLLGGKI